MLTKYPEFDIAIRIKQGNLNPVGNCVSLSDVGTYVVYDSSMKRIGTTDERLLFHTLYYLSSEELQTAGGSGSRCSGKDEGEEETSVGIISGNTPEEKAAIDDMASAAAAAGQSGDTAATVSI